MRVDKDDNIWVIDKGSDMIIRFNPEGRVDHGVRPQAGSLGRRHRAARSIQIRRRPPTTAASGSRPTSPWDPQGNIFISDGYINSRIAKVDKNGNWVKSWGDRGNKPGEFNTPHSIAADAKGNIYVADRGNRRIQVFDTDGKFLRMMKIDVPVDQDARPAIGNKPNLQTYQTGLDHGAGRAVDDVHHAAAKPGAVHVRRLSGARVQD